jgi:hypothetical protein
LSGLPETNNGTLTGRQLVMVRLGKVLARSKVSDIERACLFLEWAVEVRSGCREQRNAAKAAQRQRRLL